MVEIVAHAPTAYYHCQHCEVVWKQTGFSDGLHEEQVRASLPPDLLADFQAVSDWVRHLVKTYGDRVVIKVIDAASLEGVWKAARHGLRRYPAVFVAGQGRFSGTDFAPAEAALHRQLAGDTEREVVTPQS
jgi:hypothetical protein